MDVLRGGEWVVNGEKIEEQGHIFDYLYIDKTVTTAKVFICVEVLPVSYRFPMIDLVLYIHIFVHKSLMRLSNDYSPTLSNPTITEMNQLGYIGNRLDQLVDVISEMMNGNKKFGIQNLKPYDRGYISLDIPNESLYGKCLMYKAQINNTEIDNCENK